MSQTDLNNKLFLYGSNLTQAQEDVLRDMLDIFNRGIVRAEDDAANFRRDIENIQRVSSKSFDDELLALRENIEKVIKSRQLEMASKMVRPVCRKRVVIPTKSIYRMGPQRVHIIPVFGQKGGFYVPRVNRSFVPRVQPPYTPSLADVRNLFPTTSHLKVIHLEKEAKKTKGSLTAYSIMRVIDYMTPDTLIETPGGELSYITQRMKTYHGIKDPMDKGEYVLHHMDSLLQIDGLDPEILNCNL